MMKGKTLAEKIAELSNPASDVFHPDIEDTLNDTAAKVENYTDISSITVPKRKLKQKLLPSQIAFDDKKYEGRRVTRKELWDLDKTGDSDVDESSLAAFQSELQIYSESDDLDEEDKAEVIGSDDAVDSGNEMTSSGEDTDGSLYDVEEGADTDLEKEDTIGDGNFQTFTKGDNFSDAEKGRALQAQLGVYDNLIESRIKLQKSLIASNKLPQSTSWNVFVDKLDGDGKSALKKAQRSLKDLLDDLLELQGRLFASNSKTKAVAGDNANKSSQVESDDEIASDTEEEEKMDNGYEPLKKRMKLKEYSQTISNRHKQFLSYRNEMINYWNQRTKLASGKLSSKSFQKFEQSTLKQIELILADKDRLVKRTQIKRSAYLPLCAEAEKSEQETADAINIEKVDANGFDSEIFDDDDFYHQILREFVERKSSDSSSAAALGRQLLEIQKLRSKSKRMVDTKASKGRRIRYDVHQKLVNFMPPIQKNSMSDEIVNDLFMSLFGKSVKFSQ
ncbi:protein AATF-like [Artemia franciscana]|uniref:protein AATF-like n=1 Tax=Artemia franciscana TaxID=6661 RepID=UPI0032DB67BA